MKAERQDSRLVQGVCAGMASMQKRSANGHHAKEDCARTGRRHDRRGPRRIFFPRLGRANVEAPCGEDCFCLGEAREKNDIFVVQDGIYHLL